MSLDDLPYDDELLLRERVADLVAGDLSAADAHALQRLIADDPQLQAEEAFWRHIQGQLPEAAHPPEVAVPGPGMAMLLRHKLHGTSGSTDYAPQPMPNPGKNPRRLLSLLPWGIAAAAVVAVAVMAVGLRSEQSWVIYDEYGAQVTLPPWEGQQAGHRPQHAVHGGQSATPPETEQRVWMGVWTRPMELQGFEQQRGLEIMRITEDSPAAKAGLQPRDVILSVDSMATATRWCLPVALQNAEPEQHLQIRYWRAGFDQPQTTELVLGKSWQ